MDLATYIENSNLQKKAFAAMIGISTSALSNYMHKRRIPRLDIAQRIVTATKGKVTIQDLLNG